MKLDKGRCKGLEPGRAPMHQHMLGADWSEYGFAETDLCFVANSKIDMRQQGMLVAQSANNLLGCIRESSISRQGKVILPLYSALMRHIWSTKHSSDLASERCGHAGGESSKGSYRWLRTCLGHWTSEKRLRVLGLFSLPKRRLGLINVYTFLMEWSKEDRARFFSVVPTNSIRCNEHKLKDRNCLNIRKTFFKLKGD